MKKRVAILIAAGIVSVIGYRGVEGISRVSAQESTESLSNGSTDQNIKKAQAKDENDLTGTYQDIGSGTQLSLIIEGDTATYALGGENNTDATVEQNCTVGSYTISGNYYYIARNLNGSLGVSSGIGEPWGQFEKISDYAEIDLSYDMAIEQAAIQEEFESMSPLEKMRSRASEIGCDNEIVDGIEYLGENLDEMGDDGDYYDEVMLGTWFYEDGTPKAMFPPMNLSDALINLNNIYRQLEYFDFINGEDISIQEVKRRGINDYWYAIVLMDIQKQQDADGNLYFLGTDPISGETVVVHGNFTKLLNGDDLLVFGASSGTAVDDTLNIEGAYVQNISSKVDDLF